MAKKKVKVKKRKDLLPIESTEIVESGGAPVLADLPMMNEPSLISSGLVTDMTANQNTGGTYTTPSDVKAAAARVTKKKVKRKKR